MEPFASVYRRACERKGGEAALEALSQRHHHRLDHPSERLEQPQEVGQLVRPRAQRVVS